MNLEKIFKNIIIVNFLIYAFFISYGVFLSSEDTRIEETTFNASEIALLIVIFIHIINFYFLFKFKSIGKVLFIPLLLIIYALSLSIPIEDVRVDSHFEFIFDALSVMIEGGIIAMLYLTDIKNKFDK